MVSGKICRACDAPYEEELEPFLAILKEELHRNPDSLSSYAGLQRIVLCRDLALLFDRPDDDRRRTSVF
jgi:hypothetical protein